MEFFSLKPEINLLKEEIMSEIDKVLSSGKFIMSDNVREFEEEIKRYFSVRYAISVNSGTDALVISLRAIGIKEGDHVITTPFTFFATAEAISIIGARPIFVDIEYDSFNIDPDLIEEVMNSEKGQKVKAILPVHLFGLPCNMERIMDIARRYNLKVVEDCAQAFGAEVKVNGQFRKVGTIGDAGAFSFFPTKNLGAYGDGGMIITNDPNVYEIASMLKNHGSKQKYYNEMFGYNSRLDEIQAAILKVKLKYIHKFNESRIQIASLYSKYLSELVHLIKIPTFDQENYHHVFHQYSIRVFNGLRDNLRHFLASNGIDTFVYYPYPIHKLPPYKDYNLTLKVAEKTSEEILSLPMYHLMDSSNVEKVVEVIRQWAKEIVKVEKSTN